MSLPTCCEYHRIDCRQGHNCPARAARAKAAATSPRTGPLRPLIREALIAYYRWARHDLQHKNPHHPDLLEIVHKLRDLRAERVTSNSIYSQIWRAL